jgi:hypothetical protein
MLFIEILIIEFVRQVLPYCKLFSNVGCNHSVPWISTHTNSRKIWVVAIWYNGFSWHRSPHGKRNDIAVWSTDMFPVAVMVWICPVARFAVMVGIVQTWGYIGLFFKSCTYYYARNRWNDITMVTTKMGPVTSTAWICPVASFTVMVGIIQIWDYARLILKSCKWYARNRWNNITVVTTKMFPVAFMVWVCPVASFTVMNGIVQIWDYIGLFLRRACDMLANVGITSLWYLRRCDL